MLIAVSHVLARCSVHVQRVPCACFCAHTRSIQLSGLSSQEEEMTGVAE